MIDIIESAPELEDEEPEEEKKGIEYILIPIGVILFILLLISNYNKRLALQKEIEELKQEKERKRMFRHKILRKRFKGLKYKPSTDYRREMIDKLLREIYEKRKSQEQNINYSTNNHPDQHHTDKPHQPESSTSPHTYNQ